MTTPKGRLIGQALHLPILALLACTTGPATAGAAAQAPATSGRAEGLHPVQQPDTRPVLRISREQAVESAMKVIRGTVTSVDLERKAGRVVWVVEVQTPEGVETDVLVDVESGEVVGTE